ncbi:iron-containing redox enzyme family protein [Frankia sp. AiPa1]|uniref:iron-containing redox enzyme family protein n=1 Tax=Frankia sp. AiPa1 TaxID=573492 RepID=UPI00202AE071|nr:iron-containing redox enzyme family protein [Frankia sp. AiPa1]MCL9760299.1 iron-containing redox enzyme family protein [Frankia sp. AiPa1]
MGTETDDLFDQLDGAISRLWAQARDGAFWRHVTAHGFDRDLYRITMTQIYHYTRHNSVNQAIAAFRAEPEQIGLLRFVYSHAGEELGHEKLVLHDLRAIGLLGPDEDVDEQPLPATDALVNYLYGVALREGPVARLGYSYWAETVYEHIGPILGRARTSLGLDDRQMAFFVAHSEIDSKHAAEVRHAIQRAVTSPAQAAAVLRVAVTTLWLTISLLDQSYAQWVLRRDAAGRQAANGGR